LRNDRFPHILTAQKENLKVRGKNLQLIVDGLKLDSETSLLNLQRRLALVLDEVDVNGAKAIGPNVGRDDPEG
jgi:hypothetical protein